VYQEAGVIPLPSQFNTLVQGLSIASITPQQILAAGEPIFLDIRTSSDINSINTLIQSYARIHAPTFGQPIPGSGLVSTLAGDGTLLAPTQNQIRRIYAIAVTNIGPIGPIVSDLFIGGVKVATANVAPLTTETLSIPSGFSSSNNLPLTMIASSGDPNDITTSCASILVVQ
jgi:hypothetical protein